MTEVLLFGAQAVFYALGGFAVFGLWALLAYGISRLLLRGE